MKLEYKHLMYQNVTTNHPKHITSVGLHFNLKEPRKTVIHDTDDNRWE